MFPVLVDSHGTGSNDSQHLIGRHDEWSDVRAHLDATAAGQGGLLLVVGEPGLGKSRLVAEAARYAANAGFITATAEAWQGQGALPLWPWIHLLRTLAEAGVPVDRDLAATFARGADRRSLLGDVDPAGARWRLFDRVTDCLIEASRTAPVLVALDDLHWADRTSLDLLRHVAGNLAGTRLAVIGAFRDSVEDGPLATLAAATTPIVLHGLPGAAVAELTRSLAGAEVAGDTVDALVRHTTGNPLFVKELVHEMTRGGVWVRDLTMASSVHDVFRQRMAGLPPSCRDVLDAASVIGPAFDVALVSAVVGRGEDAVVGELGDTTASHVVEAVGYGRYRFVHDVFRQSFLDDLGWSRTQRLHLRVGEAIEATGADGSDASIGDLARHFLAAGRLADAGKVADYGYRAGMRAAAILAFDEAIDYLQRSLDVAGDVAPARRAELMVALGDMKRRARDVAGARTVLREAARLARQSGAAAVFADAALAFGGGLGGNHPIASADRDVIAMVEEALDLLPDDDSPRRCRLLGRLATELYLTDDIDRRDAVSAESLAMARRLDDPGCLATALYSRQMATFGPDGVAERDAAAGEILQLAERVGDVELELWGHLFRCWSLAERCQPTDAELRRCAELADQLGLPGYRAEVAMRQAVRALVAGEFRQAEQLLEIVQAGGATDMSGGSTSTALVALRAALEGPHEVLAELVSALLAEQPDTVMWRAGLVVVYVELNRLSDARREFDTIADTGFAMPRDGLWLNGMFYMGFGCFALGAVEHADELRRRLIPYVYQAPIGSYGSMATPLGLIEAARGDFDEALRWLDIGRRRNLAIGNRAYALFTERERAAVLLARGRDTDRADATATLTKVIADFERLGFTGFTARAQSLLANATP